MNRTEGELLVGAGAANGTVGALTGIWERVLGAQGIRSDQDFFDLGGNSVLLVGMLELVQSELGKEVDVGKLAEAGACGVTINIVASLLS